MADCFVYRKLPKGRRGVFQLKREHFVRSHRKEVEHFLSHGLQVTRNCQYKLIEMARRKIGYAETTVAFDIGAALQKTYRELYS